MVDSYITLKYIGEETGSTSLVLIHETAHRLHEVLDKGLNNLFSRMWLGRYPKLRIKNQEGLYQNWNSLTNDDLKLTGTVSRYANFDICKDQRIMVTSEKKNRTVMKKGLTLEYSVEDLNGVSEEIYLNTLLRDRENMPERMADVLNYVRFDPSASHHHMKPQNFLSMEYDRVREDIADSCEQFTSAALVPYKNKNLIERIHDESILQAKIHDLANYGFIKHEVANFLLDPQILNGDYPEVEKIYGVGWKKGTVFPPFIGLVPEKLSSEIINIIDYNYGSLDFANDGICVKKLNVDGKDYFSSSFIDNTQISGKITAFILTRSDLGVINFFIGKHKLQNLFDDNMKDGYRDSLWINGPGIDTPQKALEYENHIFRMFDFIKGND